MAWPIIAVRCELFCLAVAASGRPLEDLGFYLVGRLILPAEAYFQVQIVYVTVLEAGVVALVSNLPRLLAE